MVDRKISGAVRSFSRSASRTATSTRLVPRSFSIPQTRYSSTMDMPPRGSSQTIQGRSPRSSAARSMPRWKATATRPTMVPIRQEYSVHFRKVSPSQMCPRARSDRRSISAIPSFPGPASPAKGYIGVYHIRRELAPPKIDFLMKKDTASCYVLRFVL